MCPQPRGLDWRVDGTDWPNRSASSFVEAGGLRWHVQRMGTGPTLLLIHGTGASTHSWRDLMPLLARHFTVIAPDLPGHGFTSMPRPRQLSLPSMALAIKALLTELDLSPDLVAGHSAGAAILLRMVLDGAITPNGVISLNGALKPFPGTAGLVFPGLARLLFVNRLTPHILSWSARDDRRVERLLKDTGSRIDDQGLALYGRLFRNSGHVAATLGMMAHWNLHPLSDNLPRLACPLLLVVGDADSIIPPQDAELVHTRVRSARIVTMPCAGHLAHEEQPEQAGEIIIGQGEELGILPPR